MRAIAQDTKTKILKEQFVPDTVFMYVATGAIRFFDGNKTYTFKAGEYGIARKNRLLKYVLLQTKERFEPIIFCFDEPFLQAFEKKHKKKEPTPAAKEDALLKVCKSELTDEFIRSLKPYRKGVMQLDEAFEELKYEELLLILLRNQPELAGVIFDYRKPEKIDLEAFMNQNFAFNVSLQRFAYLTGRSLSAFKRDFTHTFHQTPNRWLVQKRLQEAYFLIDQKQKKSSDIYLDLGFESLSHFSFSFKKLFGFTPTELAAGKKRPE